ncbi:uncharacterized protein LOC120276007 [Dioscorea cayenensis subsp. rotundata]|uniref:Uncharacterized protein LOC120276007 n=1 Tax=Dioscorea cayennensis subsp. rotundata TaxID=55577 RepID=A0AB40CJ98_DIOCR|nr:uncharacterized protein LOC120276007 [Dioscorea cayenensis subsp. rotundata]
MPEDFTFPATIHHLPFTDSPTWFSPPPNIINTRKQAHRKTFSGGWTPETLKKDLRVASSPKSNDRGDHRYLYEERMDMLWEDFNEELQCNAVNIPCELRRRDVDSSVVELRPDQALRRRRPNLLLMLKVLRKLFLIQRTQTRRRVVVHREAT